MKKFLFALLFILAISGVSVTAAYAGADCEPGCHCPKNPNYDPNDASQGPLYPTDSVYGAQEQISQAEQVKEKAYAQEIIKQPDNAPGMTCLDRAMGLTSQLGSIFSDKFPDDIPAASTALFGDVVFRDAGTGTANPSDPSKGGPYAKALQSVISENLKKYAEDFDDTATTDGSLSAQLGATSLTGLDTLVNGLTSQILGATGITSALGDLNSWLYDANSLLNGVGGYWEDYGGYFDTAMGFLGLSGLASAIGSIFDVMDSIGDIMDDVIDAFNNISDYLSQILGNLVNLDMLSGGAGVQDCDRIGKLWGNKAGPSGFPALTGSGNDKGAPYFRLADMISGTDMPTVGNNLLRALGNDSGVLQAAFDVLDSGILSGNVGASPIWPDTPQNLNSASTIQDIINVMN